MIHNASIMIEPNFRTEELSQEGLRIRLCRVGDAPHLALLHAESFSSQFGTEIMGHYYRACIDSRNNFLVCAEKDEVIVAYLGAIADRREIFLRMLHEHAFTIFRRVVWPPSALWRFLRQRWNWSGRSPVAKKQVARPQCEYRPVVVSQKYRGRGLAQLLVTVAGRLLAERGVAEAYVLVHNKNLSAFRVYQKAGFQAAWSECTESRLLFKALPGRYAPLSGFLSGETTK